MRRGPSPDPGRTQSGPSKTRGGFWGWWRVIVCLISGGVRAGCFGGCFGRVLGVVFGLVLGVGFRGRSAVDFGRVCVALPHGKKRRGGVGSGAGLAGRLVVFFLDFFGDL